MLETLLFLISINIETEGEEKYKWKCFITQHGIPFTQALMALSIKNSNLSRKLSRNTGTAFKN